MNITQILSLGRKLAYADSAQVPDVDALTYAQTVYNDLWNTVVREVNADYFAYTWYIDTKSGVSTYGLPVASADSSGLFASVTVNVRFSASDTVYRKLRQGSLASLQEDTSVYANVIPDQGFFILSGNYVQIFPVPDEGLIAGLKICGIKNADSLTLSTTEAQLALPIPYHSLVSLGMRRYIYESRGMLAEANAAKQEYEEEKKRMVEQLSVRHMEPVESREPYLGNLI